MSTQRFCTSGTQCPGWQGTLLALLVVASSLSSCTKDGTASAATGFQGRGGSMARFAIQGAWLYTVDSRKLTTYNLANPADPQLVHTQDVGFEIETIFPFGDKLFIGSTSVIHIFSIDNPARPERLSTAISPTVMRRCDPVVAKDTVAYATLRSGTDCGGIQSILAVFDIKNITTPVQRFTYTLSAPRGLGYSDTILYVCDPPGLKIFNISNAFAPEYLGAITGDEYWDVIPYGDRLYAWVKGGGIIFDIAQPRLPVLQSRLP